MWMRVRLAHGLRDRTKDRKVSAALAIRELSVWVRSELKGDHHAWICREARSTPSWMAQEDEVVRCRSRRVVRSSGDR